MFRLQCARKAVVAMGLIAAVATPRGYGDFVSAGRVAAESRDGNFRVNAGTVSEVTLAVEETRRLLYDVTGETWKQADAEAYDLDDFGMDDNYPTVGFSVEKAWKYFTLQFETSFFDADQEAIAQRNYYLTVGDDIEYNGRTYDHLKINEGTQFSSELTGAIIDLTGGFTPVTFHLGDQCTLTPSFELGLFGLVGQYEVDAGDPQGVVVYQNPPEEFVVGGKASDFGGAALPEAGLGLELRCGQPDGMNLVLQGHYLVCQYDGSTSYLTSNSHREKDADIDHTNLRARCQLEFPFKNGRALTIGVQYQKVDSEALIESQADSSEEALVLRERFDKYAEFGLESFQGTLGVTF